MKHPWVRRVLVRRDFRRIVIDVGERVPGDCRPAQALVVLTGAF
jgi:hypothetical protein